MKVERIVSMVLSPHIYGIIVTTLLWQRFGGEILILLYLYFFISIGPLIPIIWDVYRGRIDIFVSRREDRVRYFLATLIFYILGWFGLIMYGIEVYLLFMATYIVMTTIHMVISLRWKISMHAAGITGPTTFLVYILGISYALLYSLLLPVWWARKKMKAHTSNQLLAGSLSSALFTWIFLEIYFSLKAFTPG